MNRRTVLFGYKYANGIMAIDKPNADIVKEIFCQYLKKKSLLEICELMNNLHIEYMPGVVDWNKARVKRILEDERYLGNDKYPQIIEVDCFDKANDIKQIRNKQKGIDRSKDIYNLDAVVICPRCKSEMKHRTEKRAKIHERWKCQNINCKNLISITDKYFFRTICDIFNNIISNPQLLQPDNDKRTELISTIRLENELNRMLERNKSKKDEIRSKILEAVSAKYDNLHNQKYETLRLRGILLNQQQFTEFPLELFNRTVSNISFDKNNNVIITLINGKTIGKEITNGETEEKSENNRTDNNCQRGRQKQIQTEACCGVLPGIHSAGRTNQQL